MTMIIFGLLKFREKYYDLPDDEDFTDMYLAGFCSLNNIYPITQKTKSKENCIIT